MTDAQARLRSDGTLLGFKQRVRSCRRWQLNWLQLDLRGDLRLGMPLGFRTHVETVTPPGKSRELAVYRNNRRTCELPVGANLFAHSFHDVALKPRP